MVKESTQTVSPRRVKDLTGIVAAFGGGNHLILLASDGTVEACGFDTDGELGNGKMSKHPSAGFDTPVKVMKLHHVVAVSAGQTNSMALDVNGNVWTWGENNFGQLGDGNTTELGHPGRSPIARNGDADLRGR